MTASATAARLEDEDQIRKLVGAYCDAVAVRDAPRAASVYAEDGVVSIDGNVLTGRPAIAEGMTATFAAFDFLHQLAHAPRLTVEGDKAKARWSVIEANIRNGDTKLGVIFGVYEDELVRLPQGWRFSRRTFKSVQRLMLETAKLKLFPAFPYAFQFPL
jgi:ketosteroid isomerase-like protein